MKMKKRFLSTLLSLAMVLGLMTGLNTTALADVTDHEHDGISFVKWTDDLAKAQHYNEESYTAANSLPAVAGNYWLDQDVTFTEDWDHGAWNIENGKSISLCLNGHTVNVKSVYIGSGSTLNLYDCKGTGAIKASGTFMSGVTLLQSTFNMHGGSITGFDNGGIDLGADSTFNMYGGSIIGNKNYTGAGVCIKQSGAKFNMQGGSITGNTASEKGGGVYMYPNADKDAFRIQGSLKITGNKAGSNSDNVYLLAENFGQVITLSGVMTESTEIGVTMDSPGVFTSGFSSKGKDSNFASDDTAYSIMTEGEELKLGKMQDPTVTPPAANSLVYNGQKQELVTAGTTDGGTLKYAVASENKEPAADAYIFDNTNLPTATDAGTYYVWYKVVGDANHNDYGPYPVIASILNAKIEPKAPTGESLVYNGKDQPLVKAGSVEGGVGTLLYAIGKDGKTAPTGGWSEAVPSARDAGTYYVWYKVQGDKNHNDTEPVALEAEIGKKSLVVNPEAQRKTYGETDPELTWTQEGLVDGDALDVTLKRAEGENVGGYAITVEKCEASDNYEAGFNEAVFTIEARSVTVTAKDQTITDGGAIKTGVKQATLSGQVKGHALSAVTLAAKGDEIAASGAKIADAEGKDVTGNYNISYAAGKLTVDPKPIAKPTVKPTKTPKPTAKPTVKPTKTPKPTAKPTKTPKPTATPKPAADPDFTLLAKMVVSGDSKTALKIAWTKVADADGYDVYFAKCGRDFKLKKTVKASESRVVRFKGLDKRENYKGYVRAWKIVKGQKVYIGKDSPQVHAITGGYDADYCNTRSVKLNHSSLTLKTGKRTTLKATVKGVKRGKKVLQHVRKVRFYSTNANVASVTSGGKVKGMGKGTCTVYAIANNGVRAKVKVTVK